MKKTKWGAAGGAAVGFMAAGPVGALVGAVLGGIFGRAGDVKDQQVGELERQYELKYPVLHEETWDLGSNEYRVNFDDMKLVFTFRTPEQNYRRIFVIRRNEGSWESMEDYDSWKKEGQRIQTNKFITAEEDYQKHQETFGKWDILCLPTLERAYQQYIIHNNPTTFFPNIYRMYSDV